MDIKWVPNMGQQNLPIETFKNQEEFKFFPIILINMSENDDFELKPIGPEDIDKIMCIEPKIFQEGIRQPKEEIQETLVRQSHIGFAAVGKDGKFYGYVLGDAVENYPYASDDSHFGSNNTVYLMSFGVVPEKRGNAIGKLLVDKFVSSASERGYKRMFGHSHLKKGSDVSLGFETVKKCGAREIGKEKEWYDTGDDAILFEKDLISKI